MKLRIGIDIGSKGAIAFFHDGVLASYQAFPLIEGRPDLQAFAKLMIDQVTGNDVHAVIEDLHSIFGTSAKSNFQFGWINGAVEAILSTFAIPYTKVQAKKWQKTMWEGVRPVEVSTGKKDKKGNMKYKVDTKATSLLAAKRLFPNESFLATARSKVPHDGIVDAVLIGLYCARNF